MTTKRSRHIYVMADTIGRSAFKPLPISLCPGHMKVREDVLNLASLWRVLESGHCICLGVVPSCFCKIQNWLASSLVSSDPKIQIFSTTLITSARPSWKLVPSTEADEIPNGFNL